MKNTLESCLFFLLLQILSEIGMVAPSDRDCRKMISNRHSDQRETSLPLSFRPSERSERVEESLEIHMNRGISRLRAKNHTPSAVKQIEFAFPMSGHRPWVTRNDNKGAKICVWITHVKNRHSLHGELSYPHFFIHSCHISPP